MPFKYASMQERILANSHESEHWSHDGVPCRIWDGATSVNRSGMRYGKISIRIKRGPNKGKIRHAKAHREAVKASGRRLSTKSVAKHLCNNTLCVEARHLRGGTQRSNVRQCVEDARHGNQHRAPVAEQQLSTDVITVIADLMRLQGIAAARGWTLPEVRMKCWCFNEEQLAAALKEYAARQPVIEVTLAPESSGISFEPMDHPKLLRDFLDSPEASKHKLLMRGIWDRADPPAIATPTGTLDPRDDAEGRN